ncbi:MAG: phage terminase large subunit family protein [Bacteroidetes bacterium]|nr:phage terminase large subunit family protein [Bacteroidota bacterium]
MSSIGIEWLYEKINDIVEEVPHISPVDYNQENRYLPGSVSSMPGYISYDINPFMREILNCADIDSPVKEITLMKGVQITYSTLLESIIMYYADHIGTLPIMYMTADKELAKARVENNMIPMFNQSDKSHIIQSSDIGNSRKSGKNEHQIQFAKGGYLVPFGAVNAAKMRSFSIAIMLKDELDAWADTVGKDGDPDSLSDARTDGYADQKKIFRGSTPLIKANSKTYKNYLKGDQRKYMVLCKHCKKEQYLRWEYIDKDTGVIGGYKWDLDDDGILITESVRYDCKSCGGSHYEADKERLYSEEYGAYWKPTAKPIEKNIRSYHLPGLYSPIGMKPWYENVILYLDAYDPIEKKVKDMTKYQIFYNNVLGEPFEIKGSSIRFITVSAHRRSIYTLGNIPNNYAIRYSESKILMLTCQVDVHKNNLAVSVMGWCRGQRPYIIDYWRFERKDNEPECNELSSPVWAKLRELIEEKIYIADDGTKYNIAITFVDAGYANDTVTTFCGDYESNVYPILGRDRPSKNQSIYEFGEFKTQQGTQGYKITVDHYKDRLAPVLRREWIEEDGTQKGYHFNAPIDLSDKQLKELTKETRKEKIDEKGSISYSWHRPGHADNELWDLLVYGHAAVEVMAKRICIDTFGMENIDWVKFWDYIEREKLFFN